MCNLMTFGQNQSANEDNVEYLKVPEQLLNEACDGNVFSTAVVKVRSELIRMIHS